MQHPTCAVQHARTRRPFSLGIAVARAALAVRRPSHSVLCRLLSQIAAFGAPFMLLVGWACDRPLSLNFGLYQVSLKGSSCGLSSHSLRRCPSRHVTRACALLCARVKGDGSHGIAASQRAVRQCTFLCAHSDGDGLHGGAAGLLGHARRELALARGLLLAACVCGGRWGLLGPLRP